MPIRGEPKPIGKVTRGYAVVDNDDWINSGIKEEEIKYGANGRPIRNRGGPSTSMAAAAIVSRPSPPLHSPCLPASSPATGTLNLVETGSLHVAAKKQPSPNLPAAVPQVEIPQVEIPQVEIPQVEVPSIAAGIANKKSKNLAKRPKIQDSDDDEQSESTLQAPSNSKPSLKRARVSAEPVSGAFDPPAPIPGSSTSAMEIDPPAVAAPASKKTLAPNKARRTNPSKVSSSAAANATLPKTGLKLTLGQPASSKPSSSQASTSKAAVPQATTSKAALPQASTSKLPPASSVRVNNTTAPNSKAGTPRPISKLNQQKQKPKLPNANPNKETNTSDLNAMAQLLGLPASKVPVQATPPPPPPPESTAPVVKTESVAMGKEKSDQGVKKEKDEKEKEKAELPVQKKKPSLFAGLKVKKNADGGTPMSESGVPPVSVFHMQPNRQHEASAEDIARETAESFNRRRELQAQEEKECRGMSRARFEEVEAMKAEWMRKREEEDRRSGPGMELMKQGHIMYKTYTSYRDLWADENRQLSETPVMPILKREAVESERGRHGGPFTQEDYEVPLPNYMARPGAIGAFAKNVPVDMALLLRDRYARRYDDDVM